MKIKKFKNNQNLHYKKKIYQNKNLVNLHKKRKKKIKNLKYKKQIQRKNFINKNNKYIL